MFSACRNVLEASPRSWALWLFGQTSLAKKTAHEFSLGSTELSFCIGSGPGGETCEPKLGPRATCAAFFLGEGPATKIDYKKVGTHIRTSLLEDLEKSATKGSNREKTSWGPHTTHRSTA